MTENVALGNHTKTTPLMTQYWEVKERYPDTLLFFRLGDFYELFFDDAVLVSSELNIVLTQRGKEKGQDIPMCGVPFHAYENYLARLVTKGYKIALCDQVETPQEAQKRGHKGPLKRDVVRVITPGTLLEDNLLQDKDHHYLMCLADDADGIGFAVCDLSTGTFQVGGLKKGDIGHHLALYRPKEILLTDALFNDGDFRKIALTVLDQDWKRRCTPLDQGRFNADNARNRLKEFYKIKTLQGLGDWTELEIKAAGTLLDYVCLTQMGPSSLLSLPVKISNQDYLRIDAFTRKSLEIDATFRGDHQGSLFYAIDRTKSAGGGRTLRGWLQKPLIDADMIKQRLSFVESYVSDMSLCGSLRAILDHFPDLERCLARIQSNRDNPRDMWAIVVVLTKIKQISEFVPIDGVDLMGDLLTKLSLAISPTFSNLYRDGGVIADGYDQELDGYRTLSKDSSHLIASLQQQYIQETGINSLKIKFNHLIGYHIDIASQHIPKVPADFIHRQGLASTSRYTTEKLNELAQQILTAEENALKRELGIVQDLRQMISAQLDLLLHLGYQVSTLDGLTALAALAMEKKWAKADITNDRVISIKNGWHPVVIDCLPSGEHFAKNDYESDEKTFFALLTGPNMAGKSTYLRQNALIIILAQIGSFVPAESAHIGVVDQIFSRVGAHDNLQAAQSTFMVEMVETAYILNQATDRSFVIFDEVGRGTSTNDGLAIAQAVIEYLLKNIRCRCLFATHFHELTHLSSDFSSIKNLTMKIQEWNNEVIFLHQVIEGNAERSYGVHVAEYAGLPKGVTRRAYDILEKLEAIPPANQMKLSSCNNVSFLDTICWQSLTPLKAFTILNSLRKDH